ncbi:GNAT family N-acetyltransferase [Aquimarina sp. 2304DJ70-9]|uniref:GNAT family N-acetyltransferase n=1 Tax=Aquimarina penaris TaxID=3231044 RepID=UPI003461A34E
MITTSPVIETKRLTLRPIENADSYAIQFLRSDLTINQYIKRPKTDTLQDAVNFIHKIKKGISNGSWVFWGITINRNPELVGTICLWNFSKERKTAEVGYDLHPELQGKGIMSEALRSVLKYGFETLQLDQIEAYTHKANEPSKYLLKKHNFNHIENRIDKDNLDNIIFTIKRS